MSSSSRKTSPAARTTPSSSSARSTQLELRRRQSAIVVVHVGDDSRSVEVTGDDACGVLHVAVLVAIDHPDFTRISAFGYDGDGECRAHWWFDRAEDAS